MQGTVLAGVELVSAIFHYQYPGKKKEYQANGNQTKKKKPPIVCLEPQLKKNAVSILIFVLLWHFYFLFFDDIEPHQGKAIWTHP